MPRGLVVIGGSLGSTEALKILLAGLPESFPLPVAIVQHRGPSDGADPASLLRRHTRLQIHEAEDKQPISPGAIYVAPAGYHLLVEPGSFALSTEEPVNHARPSIDVLFETAAESYGAGTIGVALTGSSRDGARGLAAIKSRGGVVLVQDPAEAESPALPQAAIAACAVDRVLPVAKIASYLYLSTLAARS
jgi:two-component system chemotaxis response regulator CheB